MKTAVIKASELQAAVSALNSIPADALQYRDGEYKDRLHQKLFYAVMRNTGILEREAEVITKGVSGIQRKYLRRDGRDAIVYETDAQGNADKQRPLFREEDKMREEVEAFLEQDIQVQVYPIPLSYIHDVGLPPFLVSRFFFCIEGEAE